MFSSLPSLLAISLLPVLISPCCYYVYGQSSNNSATNDTSQSSPATIYNNTYTIYHNQPIVLNSINQLSWSTQLNTRNVTLNTSIIEQYLPLGTYDVTTDTYQFQV